MCHLFSKCMLIWNRNRDDLMAVTHIISLAIWKYGCHILQIVPSQASFSIETSYLHARLPENCKYPVHFVTFSLFSWYIAPIWISFL